MDLNNHEQMKKPVYKTRNARDIRPKTIEDNMLRQKGTE